MIHGPCGTLNQSSICIENGECTKKFPKQFCENTQASVDGYPQYRRRNNGRTATVCGLEVDNRWVVPYNPYLTQKFNAHINLEACMSIKSVKYLYKYIYKGHDCANLEINERLDHDEISTFLDTRYVSAPEGIWRLFEFNMHGKSSPICRLALHLPNNQNVYFRAGEEHAAGERAIQQDTHLTAWFKLNQQNEYARQFLYTEIPNHFVWDTSNRKWKLRRKGDTIPRMYAARPNEGERFFLRLLLLHVRGATSFEDLRTVDETVANTFREACELRGLLENDAEWNQTMLEATFSQMPSNLR